jgi:heme oxygenase
LLGCSRSARWLPTKRVEAQLDLLDTGLTASRLVRVIEGFCGFWGGSEPAIDRWAAAHPVEAVAPQWPRRRRTHLFVADLAAMGRSHDDLPMVSCAPPASGHLEQAEVLGWLYVTEGSTLGGAIIQRHLQSLTGLRGMRPHCFTPYPEGPGPMWRSFKAVVEDFAAGNSGRTGAVIDAAAATFDSLERWLVPLAAGSPA